MMTFLFFCLQSFAAPDAPAEILARVAPRELRLAVVPPDRLFQSKKHRRPTLAYWRGDLNKDGREDIVIAAVAKVSEVESDGYLVFATREGQNWKLTQTQKFPSVSGPGLKDHAREGFLLFIGSFSGETPQKVQWDAAGKRYSLADAPDSSLAN